MTQGSELLLVRDWQNFYTLIGTAAATLTGLMFVVTTLIAGVDRKGVPRVHIAPAWLLQKEPVTAPIIGVTKISHLEDAVGALSVKLIQEEVAYLEEPYIPHRIVGHQ